MESGPKTLDFGRFKSNIYWSSLVLSYRASNENFLSGYYVTADTQSHIVMLYAEEHYCVK